jgi:hypothetical protein
MTTQGRQLWVALLSLAIGATMLHYRVHPPDNLTHLLPNLFSLIDLVLVSFFFLFRGTALVGVLLNSFLAFIGIIMMSDFSLSATMGGQMKVMPSKDFLGWFLHTTFPYIAILAADYFLGLALYRTILAGGRQPADSPKSL